MHWLASANNVRNRVLAEHQRTNDRREPLTMEYRLLHLDGHVFWIHDEVAVTAGPDGEQVWQGMTTSITADKDASQTLHAAESRFRTLR